MLELALFFPVKYKKFYVNPFRLQKIQAMLYTLLPKSKVHLCLLDINDCDFNANIDSKVFDLIVVDIPEGEISAFTDEISSMRTHNFLLTGDEIKYGESQAIFDRLLPKFPYNFYGAIEDEDIVLFVKHYIENGCIEYEPGMLAFSNTDRQELLKTQQDERKKYSLEFPNWMVELYKRKGIQIFLEGLSQGCENNCSFCRLNNSQGIDSVKIIKDSEVDIIETINVLQEYKLKNIYIQFTDQNFFGGGLRRLTRINDLCNRLSEIQFSGILGIDTRLDTICNPAEADDIARLRKSTWKKLSENGLRYCFLGVETFSETQSERYHKRLDLTRFDDAISMLDEMSICYTIGLILWDPLMSKIELINNLDYIKEKSLLGRTASLLKCLRVQVNSQYFKNYKDLFCMEFRSSDYFNLDDDCICYRDHELQKILPLVKYAYNLFNRCGYRHSDVACFNALFDENTPAIIRNIPFYVAQFEYELLQYLLNLSPATVYSQMYLEIRTRCRLLVSNILSELEKPNFLNADSVNVVRQYYYQVFNRISSEIESTG